MVLSEKNGTMHKISWRMIIVKIVLTWQSPLVYVHGFFMVLFSFYKQFHIQSKAELAEYYTSHGEEWVGQMVEFYRNGGGKNVSDEEIGQTLVAHLREVFSAPKFALPLSMYLASSSWAITKMGVLIL